MLNILKEFSENAKSWGVKIESGWDPRLPPFPKQKTKQLLFSPETLELHESDLSGLREIYNNNHNRSTIKLSFEKEIENQIESIKSSVRSIVALENILDMQKDERLFALRHLIQTLKSIDLKQIVDFLNNHDLTKDQKFVYIALEVGDPLNFLNGVQSMDCYEAINEQFSKTINDDSDKLDCFGNPMSGFEKKMPKLRVGKFNLPMYSKNDDNRCYSKFGLKSTDACPIGDVSRTQFTDFLQHTLKPENESVDDQPGLFYREDKTLVLSTILSKNSLLESAGYGDKFKQMDKISWEKEINNLITMMRGNAVDNKPPPGSIMHLFLPSNGPPIPQYHRTIPSDKLAYYIERWRDGLNNGNTNWRFKSSNIRIAYRTLNNAWKQHSNELTKISIDSIALSDCYEFFFDNPGAIQKIANHFSNRCVPMILICRNGEGEINGFKSPYELNYLVPLMNVILHKLGFLQETFMKNWAYCLGKLFQQADVIHWKYYSSRGRTSPPKIGFQFCRMAYNNPQQSLASFQDRFAPYLAWAMGDGEDSGNGYGVAKYGELLQSVVQLSEGSIPVRMTPNDRILLGAGYVDREYKKNDDDKEQDLEKGLV